jgi:hypothetical protein
MPDHHDWEAQVDAAEGADTPVSVRLLPREEQRAKKTEPRAPPARRAPERTAPGAAPGGDAHSKGVAAPTPPPPTPIDPAKLEGDINRALRNAGLRGVTAEVGDDQVVTLKGSIGSTAEKRRAISLAETFRGRGVKRIKDVVFVVED